MTHENIIIQFHCELGKEIRIKNDELLFGVTTHSMKFLRTMPEQTIILYENIIKVHIGLNVAITKISHSFSC